MMSSPTNNPPKPIIKRPNYRFEYEHERKEKRIGRGFSIGELEKAGLNINNARKLGIIVDIRRKSVHEENVE
ncbi:MAG: 50S ribosomal protein L13e, partial [Sulfolobaceae archaeon]